MMQSKESVFQFSYLFSFIYLLVSSFQKLNVKVFEVTGQCSEYYIRNEMDYEYIHLGKI